MAFVPKKIALDTSALVQKKGLLEKIRNAYGNKIEIVVPEQVKKELLSLKNRNRALEKKIFIIEREQKEFGVKEKKVAAKNADEALLALAEKGFAVLSLDQKLKKRVLEKKGLLVEIRGNYFCKITGG